ncbi:unnamed protein product, partial [marine sediment metagenome]
MLNVLSKHPEGLGVNELFRNITKTKGFNSKTTFFKNYEQAKEDKLIKFIKKEKQGKKIYGLTEKGKTFLAGRELTSILKDLPFLSSSDAVHEMIQNFVSGLKGLFRMEREGPEKLDSVDIM